MDLTLGGFDFGEEKKWKKKKMHTRWSWLRQC